MKNLTIIVITLLLVQCEPIIPQNSTLNKQIFFDDYAYEDFVGNVEIVPYQSAAPSSLENPVVSTDPSEQLKINFDLLTDQFENLSAKIYHCNMDWTKSQLRDLEFLNEINNFRITEFDYSVNTVQPYIHYRFTIPKPKISGNYILAVFRRSNPDDLILTRKFLVVESIATIDHIVRVSTTIEKRDENQQIEFNVNYGDLLVNIPTKDIRPVILQNHNWNTAITKIPPTLIRANEGSIEYENLDLTTNFSGWHESRFTDLRTLSITGRNVAKITSNVNRIDAILGIDKARRGTYTQPFQDINGDYVIQNDDPGLDFLNSDYANVQFMLQSERVNGSVYVTGRFNNWKLEDRNRMRYDESSNAYIANIFLKQGYYEYLYNVESATAPPFYFEGSHFLAENEYEILVYYRRPGNINDEIVGYKKFRSR